MGDKNNLQGIHKVYDAFGHGDVMVVLGHYTFNVVKTGKVVDNDFVHTLQLAEGRISAFEGYEDSAVVAAFTAGSN